jgi:hypothetical protein
MVFIILGCLAVYLGYAQENWVYSYTSGGAMDRAEALVYGSDNNIYAAGGIGGYYTVMSLATSGDTNWTYMQADGLIPAWSAYAIDYGSDGYVYTTGWTFAFIGNTDLFVTKHVTTTGDTMWIQRVDFGDYEQGNSVVYGDDGNIYVTGYAYRSDYGMDFAIVSLAATGDTNWIYRYPGDLVDSAGSSNEGLSIVYGNDGNIYAAGRVDDAYGKSDFAVISLTNTGVVRNAYFYGTEDNDAAKSILYGDDGNLYVAGYCNSASMQYWSDWRVMSLTTLGSVRWIDSLTQGTGVIGDVANKIVYGADGNLYAAGYTGNQGSNRDFTVVSYTTDGTKRWEYKSAAMNGNDMATSLVYGGGKLFVAGYGALSLATDNDIIVMCFNPNSDTIWRYTYDRYGYEDIVSAIDYGSDGNVYVAGKTEVGSSNSEFTVVSLPANFPPTIPTLISPSNGSYLNNLTVTFNWHTSEDPENDIINYILQYDTDPEFSKPESIIIGTTTQQIALSNNTYYWRVRAKDNQQNFSQWSEVWSFSFDLVQPNTPVLIYPTENIILAEGSINFDWTTVTCKTGSFDVYLNGGSDGGTRAAPVHYLLQVDRNDAFTSPIVNDTFENDQATVNLSDDFYFWRVKAFDLAGNESPFSSMETFGVDISAPVIDSTTELTHTDEAGPFLVNTKVTDAVSGVDSVYLYYWRTKSDPTWFYIKMSAGENDWYHEWIPATSESSDTTKYYIKAWDGVGHVAFDPSNAPNNYYWFIANMPTGTDDFDNRPTSFSFTLMNNPCKIGNVLFHVALPDLGEITLHIYDALGRKIKTLAHGAMSAGYYEIPWTDDVNAGVYFYSFESRWQNRVGKLVLIR